MAGSNLPLQVCIYFHRILDVPFALMTAILLLVKASIFPYPEGFLAMEFAILLVWCLNDFLRLLVGENGNKLGDLGSLSLFLLLCVPAIFGHLYWILWQVYVFSVDTVVNSVFLVFLAVEMVTAVITIVRRNTA